MTVVVRIMGDIRPMEAEVIEVVVVPLQSPCLCGQAPAVDAGRFTIWWLFTATVTRWQHMLSATYGSYLLKKDGRDIQ